MANSKGTKALNPDYLGNYFHPYFLNQASFDCFPITSEDTLILLQIVIGMKHNIKVDAVCAIIYRLLQTISKIFIV